MLPSTGHFKSFPCPYFNSNSASVGGSTAPTCHRPYCHFKHVRKDEPEMGAAGSTQPANSTPVYIPAPKLLTLPEFSKITSKKKVTLEYRPEKPEFDASPSTKHTTKEQSQVPIYIPAPTKCNGESSSTFLNLEDCNQELHELGEIIDSEMADCTEDSKENIVKVKEEEGLTSNIKDDILTSIKIEKTSEGPNEPTEKSNNSKSREQRGDQRDSTNSSSSSKYKHTHKSSVKSKESTDSREKKSYKTEERKRDKEKDKEKPVKSENNKEKDKGKETEIKKERNAKSTSSSSSSKHKPSSSSSHKSSDKDKHRSSTSSSSRHKSSTSSKSSRSHHKSSRTSPSSKRKSSPVISIRSTDNDVETSSIATVDSVATVDLVEKYELDNKTSELCATSQEDIMKECEMIYDQLEQEFASLHKTNARNGEELQTAPKRKASEDDDDNSAAAATQKKRIAYENADKLKSSMAPVPRKPNHIRNAMQAIFNRQQVLRQQQEEEAAAAAVALREAEEKVREANEALRKAKEKNNLTPLIPKSYLTPPARPFSRSIAPVANMLALERAKKKVEELKAEKKPMITIAQSTKGTARMAHKPTPTFYATEPEKQPKPPVLEANSTKISYNVRMQYYEMMVKHCLVMYPNVADAWERAQTEELAVLKKCNTSMIYKSSALLTINKLRKEAAESGNKPITGNKMVSHEVILAGKLAQSASSWSVQKKMRTEASVGGEPFDKLASDKAFEAVYDLRLTEELLIANGFPRPGKRPGTAVITNVRQNRQPNDETERYCCRCGKVYSTSIYDEVCADLCNFHPKSTGYRRGYADNHHRCCQQPAGSPGCTYANYHVTNYLDVDNLTGYVTTIDKDEDYVSTKRDIYALDCEMCYTTYGIELTRVTVVDINARTVYDALVKPDNKIVDYNTVYSGITEQMLANETRTLRDVQAILLSMFHSRTILVGHSLESDLKALKLIHSVVVDTSVLFPHKMGPPKKRALKTLCIENLKRIIQENEAGHDSAEDAEVCIQLVKFYLRNKIS